MPQKGYGVQHVVHISISAKHAVRRCQNFRIGLERFAESVNHYIEKHGYKLFHVGSETSDDSEGKPGHSTVAVICIARLS